MSHSHSSESDDEIVYIRDDININQMRFSISSYGLSTCIQLKLDIRVPGAQTQS